MTHTAKSLYPKHVASTILVVLQLSACAPAPTRTDSDEFFILKEGRIEPKNSTTFVDCLLDGFDKAHFMLTNITHRQQRRADSFRVESLAGGRILIISADVFDDGRVVLYESTSAALINTTGQREAFYSCLRQYSSTR